MDILRCSSEEFLTELLDQKRPVCDVLCRGMPALCYCASMYDEELALRIAREGVDLDVNAQDPSGYSALHFAAEFDLPELVEALLVEPTCFPPTSPPARSLPADICALIPSVFFGF